LLLCCYTAILLYYYNVHLTHTHTHTDVVAVEVLTSGRVPPVANFSSVDPNLGTDLKISTGGVYPCKYAMRFAAGFGSQIALALYGI
jgi:3-oxoacyl-(acyl-carrier-protein) synthase